MSKIKLLEKISIIDIIVVAALIFVLICVYQKYSEVALNSSVSGVDSGINFEYTVKFQNVRPTSGQMLQVGDVVYDKVSGTQIGKINSVNVTPTRLQLETMTGEVINDDFEERSDIVITVETWGSIKNGEYMACDLIRILLGKNLEMETKYVTISGEIIDIKKMEIYGG